MWITNGGFADVFIVFAKVDGEKEKFSAFVVPRSENCRPAAEEHKMGIKSSSTTAVVLSDAKIPVRNLIGKVGDGAKIAFDILNVGRFKLGASVTGGAKLAIHEAVRYANERHQFNKPISSFGAMKHKLAEMAIKTWVSEAITYRTVGMIDALIGDGTDNETKLNPLTNTRLKVRLTKFFARNHWIMSLMKWCKFTAVTAIRRNIRRKKLIEIRASIAFLKAQTKSIDC